MLRSLLRPTTSMALATGRRSMSTTPLSTPGSILFLFIFFFLFSFFLSFRFRAKLFSPCSVFPLTTLLSPPATQNRFALLAGGALVGTGAYLLTADTVKAESNTNWEDVKADIVNLLENENYDDGSYGPLFVRLAWHASGTYDVASKTGGSNGATMRYAPESTDGANAGLDLARNLLEPLKKVFFFFFSLSFSFFPFLFPNISPPPNPEIPLRLLR